MNILQMASAKIGLSTEKIFGDAYSYYEVRVSKQEVCDKFMDYAYEGSIPEHVKDFCIEILAERVTRTKQLK